MNPYLAAHKPLEQGLRAQGAVLQRHALGLRHEDGAQGADGVGGRQDRQRHLQRHLRKGSRKDRLELTSNHGASDLHNALGVIGW